MMAEMFVDEFADLLATEDLSENNALPAPNKLLNKIILKGRPISKRKVRLEYFGSYCYFLIKNLFLHDIELTNRTSKKRNFQLLDISILFCRDCFESLQMQNRNSTNIFSQTNLTKILLGKQTS